MLLLSVACLPVCAQDTVTIPKSRLQELERKEAELQRLKGAPSPTNTPPVQTPAVEPARNPTAAPTRTTAPLPAPPPARPAPAAPLQPGEVVEAADLSSQYRADPAAADARYRKKTFTVRGEIVGFEKPILTSNYKVLLKTGEPQARVVCDFMAPADASAVFTVNHGLELVKQVEGGRIPLAKVGDVVLVRGQCRGWHGQEVTINGREFTPAAH